MTNHEPDAPLSRVSYVMPILYSVFCCLPMGIPIFFCTAQANAAVEAGDRERFQRMMAHRDTLAVIGALLLVGALLVPVIVGLGAGFQK